jgi:hypothetical protein
VTQSSNALDLDSGVFTWNFYMNRAGAHLPAKQKRVLARAKEELRKQFGSE